MSRDDTTAPPARALHVQEGVYRADKVLYHRDRVRDLRAGAPIAPVTAHLVISDLCNHGCAFCSFRMEDNLQNAWFAEQTGGRRNNNPDRRIPTAKALEILDDMAALGVKAVEFTGGGEPTVHPDHLRIFQHCLARGLEASLVTNGQLVTALAVPTLARFVWVRFSIDAARADTYARVRRVAPRGFRQALDNAARLLHYRNAVGSSTAIGAGFVVYRENWHEAWEAARLYKEIGFDNVRFGAIFNSAQKASAFDGFLDDARALCDRAKRELEDDRFRVINNFDARCDDLGFDGRPGYPRCYYQELATYIGGDLKVYRCCDTAYNPIGFLGSLENRRFADLWHEVCRSHALRAFRPDQQCEFCMFNNRNLLLAEYADPDGPELPHGARPDHVNFV